VIDVLTAVAAADRRTVGNADVDVWHAVIGDLPKDLALRAVRDHLREKPGVWLEPGHIYERVRAIRRDQLEREPDEQRNARQEALAAKVAEEVAELAASKAVPKYRRPNASPLTVKCPWCKAGIGTRCVIPATSIQMTNTSFHPLRVEAAEKAMANA
jgi:hypothetical protein